MFKQTTYSINSYEVLSVRNLKGVGIDIIPQKGGAIHQLYLGENGTPILNPFIKGTDIKSNPWYKQALLFPFPNRLNNGTYVHNDIEYHFPINETDRNNALHGFLNKETLEVSEVNCKENEVEVKLTYEYNGHYPHYPFPCKLSITYLVAENTFQLSFQIENTGSTSLPYGFGWHPYFLFEHQAEISMPTTYRQIVDKRLLPTGEEVLYNDLTTYKTLHTSLDTCFRFIDNPTVKIGNSNSYQLEIRSTQSMDYMQIFNPEPNLIAVEPVTCNIDAFNTKKGLTNLMPNEYGIHQCEVLFIC